MCFANVTSPGTSAAAAATVRVPEPDTPTSAAPSTTIEARAGNGRDSLFIADTPGRVDNAPPAPDSPRYLTPQVAMLPPPLAAVNDVLCSGFRATALASHRPWVRPCGSSAILNPEPRLPSPESRPL